MPPKRRHPAHESPQTWGEPWDPQDLLFLVDAIQSGIGVPRVAMFLRRTPEEVSEKAKHLKLVAERAG
jgi:hypothetical protein